ncbi:MAG: serine/threonine protein kinase, partial [Myxococcales bacterium]|nr:serine/threonine protein kinase [Myxococcales bacterium]
MTTPTELPTPVDSDLEAGERVGEYEVAGKLGQGAFGTVFRAVHPVIGKEVAIKVLARKFSVDPEMVSRFVAEARAVNQIRHRHIIDIFSFGALDDGRQYYVMEYLDGEPLDALLDREKQIPIASALSILRAIAKALDAAHAKGIAHRDLKAENVFLGRDPDGGVFPKLLDFGIAKLMGTEEALKHKTRTGAPIGTPYYMSPEQCRGKDVDHRTDIYAFGVLVYLMLTGVYPFDADDYMSILMKQITEEPSAPSTLNADLTPAIDDAVAWMMKKDPADRPPDLRTAMRALEQAASAAGLASTPSQGWDIASSPSLRPYETQPVATATPQATRALRGVATPTGDLPPRRRSKVPLFAIGALAAAAIGVVVVFATRSSGDTPRPAPPPVSEPTPPAPRPPTPPPPAPIVQPEVDTPEEPPQTVIISITGVPEGTEVFAGGMTVGAAP